MSLVQPQFKIARVEMPIQAWRNEVHRRADRRCEVRCAGCTGRSTHAHHIKLDGQGGLNVPLNGLSLCHSCHEWVHHNPDVSAVNGWICRVSPRHGDFHFVEVSGE